MPENDIADGMGQVAAAYGGEETFDPAAQPLPGTPDEQVPQEFAQPGYGQYVPDYDPSYDPTIEPPDYFGEPFDPELMSVAEAQQTPEGQDYLAQYADQQVRYNEGVALAAQLTEQALGQVGLSPASEDAPQNREMILQRAEALMPEMLAQYGPGPLAATAAIAQSAQEVQGVSRYRVLENEFLKHFPNARNNGNVP